MNDEPTTDSAHSTGVICAGRSRHSGTLGSTTSCCSYPRRRPARTCRGLLLLGWTALGRLGGGLCGRNVQRRTLWRQRYKCRQPQVAASQILPAHPRTRARGRPGSRSFPRLTAAPAVRSRQAGSPFSAAALGFLLLRPVRASRSRCRRLRHAGAGNGAGAASARCGTTGISRKDLTDSSRRLSGLVLVSFSSRPLISIQRPTIVSLMPRSSASSSSSARVSTAASHVASVTLTGPSRGLVNRNLSRSFPPRWRHPVTVITALSSGGSRAAF